MGFTDEHKTFRLTVLIGDPSQDISVRLFSSTVTSTLQLIFFFTVVPGPDLWDSVTFCCE